ncbi:multifunctional CCA addition/repair protein [Kangiella sp. TOML190]|uniref:multifunctional CCA addition/repair protein n=1 Tax=Kangiella sp. TOML190 TaxID=2931351 RepID=UPI00203FAD17|nr:multifunctional CCA addition/repair protein [Kangiella sp. TOML190]
MKIYLVGGAVRDALLGLEVKDRDFLVVGATPKAMLDAGFKEVGQDFPVFLHPNTFEEYALARTERKSGKGYKGFSVDFSSDISIEQDLIRRDLTINAIAQADDGSLIDPYGGQNDLDNKLLRHISPAFAEDPLRVLRVARFAARFHHLGFTIADETLALMTQLSKTEVSELTAERAWQETYRALLTDSPWIYFEVLRQCGALKLLIPELDKLWGIPNPEKWHPEIDTGVHTMMVLEQAAKKTQDPVVRFAALFHDLGKGETPVEQWPHHKGHEGAGVAVINNACRRLKTPKEYQELAVQVSRYHLHCHKMFELRPNTILKVLKGLKAYRNPDFLKQFITACEADFNGRLHNEDKPYPQGEYLWQCYGISKDVDTQALIEEGYEGKKLGEAIDRQRLLAIKQLIKN